ncbi:MAG: copper chaperone PCu(A)C [Dehalococcoidia bacterium]
MNRYVLLLAALALPAMLLFAACGDDDDDDTNADDGHAHKIEAVDARAQSAANDVAAVFVTLKNDGDADFLISAEIIGEMADRVGDVQLHEVITEGSTSKMQQIEKIEVPGKGELVLKSGSYHVMLLSVDPPLAEGDKIEVKLNFEHADPVTFSATVAKPGANATPGMSHN